MADTEKSGAVVDGTKTILLVGVGGQGTILAGKLLATVAAGAGLDVKVSEIHGMSQSARSRCRPVPFQPGRRTARRPTGRWRCG